MARRANRRQLGHQELVGVAKTMEETRKEQIKKGRIEPPKKVKFDENSAWDRSKFSYKMARAGAPVANLSPLTRAKIILRAALDKKK